MDGGFLVLAVIVADCHGEEKAVHAAATLSAQHLQALEEFPEVFVHALAGIHRMQEKVLEAGDREPQGGEPEFIGKGIPFDEGQRTPTLIPSEQRLESFDDEVSLAIAQRVHRGREVEEKFSVTGRLEVQQPYDLLSPKEQVIGEQVAMNEALGESVILVFLLVADLVIQRVDDLPEMPRQMFSHFLIESDNARKAEAVLFALRGMLAQEVQGGQCLADVGEMSGCQPGFAHGLSR